MKHKLQKYVSNKIILLDQIVKRICDNRAQSYVLRRKKMKKVQKAALFFCLCFYQQVMGLI